MTADRLVHLLAVQAVQLTVVIVIIGPAAMLLRRKPHLAYALWLAALAKCLVPPFWSSPMGLFSWAAFEQSPAPALIRSPAAEPRAVEPHPDSIAIAPEFGHVPSYASPVAVVPIAPRRLSWATIVAMTWLSGAAGILAATAIASARLYRRVRRSAVLVPCEIDEMVESVRNDIGLRRRVRLLATDAEVGPAVLGTLRPTIVFPKPMLDGPLSALRAVLAHESAHVRRGDAIIAVMQRVAVALWWFHPLVWLMSRRCDAAREQCCDEETVAALRLDPANYAQMLFDVARRRREGSLAFYPGVHAMQVTKQRMARLMDERTRFHRRAPRAAWVALAAAALVLLPGAALTWQRPAAGQNAAPATRPVPQRSGPLILHGSVTDSVTHEPIAGATITVSWHGYTERPGTAAADEIVLGPPTTLTSGRDGKYDLPVPADWAAKPWLMIGVTIHHPRYGSTIEDFSGLHLLPSGKLVGNPESGLNRQMQPCDEMTGKVIAPDGTPAAGVPVKSVSSDPLVAKLVLDEGVTGPRGDFSLHVVRRVVRHASTWLWVLPANAGAVQQDMSGRWDAGVIRLPTGAPVTGAISDANGKPLAGASIFVTQSGLDFPIREATTDGNGKYHTAPLAAGKYELQVNAPRGRFAYLPAVLTVPQPALPQRVDFKVEAQARITLHTVDPQGKPTQALSTLLSGLHDGVLLSKVSRSISNDAVDLLVPKGVEQAQIGVNVLCYTDGKTVARYRRGNSPAVAADVIDLGTITGDVDDITIIRYLGAKLTIHLFGPDGTAVNDTRAYRLQGSYTKVKTRPKGTRGSGQAELTLFLHTSRDGEAWQIDSVLPDEEIKLTATGPGAMPEAATVTLKEGEERSIDIHLKPAPTTRPKDH